MNKQRDVLKGRVKKLLKSQKDMGQISEPALLCCVSSLEVFVRDLAGKIKEQAAASGGDGQTVTPIELKRAVEGSSELAFLHDKIAEIDEGAVKYHKAQQRKGKRAAGAAAGESKRPTKKTDTTNAARRAGAGQQPQANEPTEGMPARSEAEIVNAPSARDSNLAIDEDDDYDESDSD